MRGPQKKSGRISRVGDDYALNMDAADHELLQAYARHRSESAFATLVARHVDLVYSAAIRQVRDSHLAKDVAQQVFAELARHAARMKPDTLLAAWLHAATRRRAIDVVRSEVRRRQREQTALELADANADARDAEWAQVAPLLDEALHSLPGPERDAVLLRYFEDKSLREVGATLGISDDAAQKRVHRALERLRDHFTKRRVPLGAAGLAALLSGHAVQAAPVGLAANLATAALLSASVTLTPMILVPKILVASTLAVSLGFGAYEARQVSRLKDQLAAIEHAATQAGLAHERRLADVSTENARLRAEVEKIRADGPASAVNPQDPMLRAMADWLDRGVALRNHVKSTPKIRIPEMQQEIEEMDWLDVTKDNRLADETDFRRAAGALRALAEKRFVQKLAAAVKKFEAANGNQFPAEVAQLQPYFEPAIDPAVLERWTVKSAREIPHSRLTFDLVITQVSIIDEMFDHRTVVGPKGAVTSIVTVVSPLDSEELKPVLRAFAAANPNPKGKRELDDLRPYAVTPAQKAALEKAIAAQKAASQ